MLDSWHRNLTLLSRPLCISVADVSTAKPLGCQLSGLTPEPRHETCCCTVLLNSSGENLLRNTTDTDTWDLWPTF
ncbi:hypothetical protein CEXT_586321 [Caerostris extrusa]|uniref:Uncharacterized protein n=1 Tax=Caerostris extrusa TaxID=172846 RepID=A0AAV4RFC3_CAEEX|nr:hypothetical protein CEXT_586321 [Caerostris extrusa]